MQQGGLRLTQVLDATFHLGEFLLCLDSSRASRTTKGRPKSWMNVDQISATNVAAMYLFWSASRTAGGMCITRQCQA